MAAHHYVGAGRPSEAFARAAKNPRALEASLRSLVEGCGLQVVAHHTARFDAGGLTAVWILAESHLVAHFWSAEGILTLDLHVCDVRRSNRERAEALVAELSRHCFTSSAPPKWTEMHLDHGLEPVPTADGPPLRSVSGGSKGTSA